MTDPAVPAPPARELLGSAHWITTPDPATPAGQRPGYEFQRTFTVPEHISRGTLTATAHGVYEAFLNGIRVGDLQLTPGISSYRRTLYVQQFDVTDLLQPGDNELRFVVSDGWYRGRTGAHRVPDGFGTEIALLAALQIDGPDGGAQIVTDVTWQTGTGEIVTADLMDGQTTDLRRRGTTAWGPVAASTDPLTEDRSRLAWSPSPAVRKLEQYEPVAITRLPNGRQVVDFGQNLNGWVELRHLGPTGTRIVLTHGEALDTAGDLTLHHLDITVAPGLPTLPVGQVDTVISRGIPGDVFEPRHTTHGFRYVAIDGLDTDLTAADLTAHQVRSDLNHIGTFDSSDERLNALHRIAVASWRANTLDIPTDCPQRERWGYTGDFQIFARSAAYLDDITGFARKWLTSLADDQLPDGKITNVAPNTGIEPEPVIPISFDGSAGWGDAATIVPWELYRAYGDPQILADFFPMMRRWVDYAAHAAATGRHVSRITARAQAAPHETYLWDTGWHWGEWLEPDVPFNPNGDPAIVATAYLAHSAGIVAQTARVLGDDDAASTYGALAENVVSAWRTEFLADDGTLSVPTQANYVRALAFHLVPSQTVPTVADHLVRLVEENGNRLSTGFLSTGLLLPTLADHGYTDVAYRLLFQEQEPGWLIMLERGATTVWESWSGIDAEGTPNESLNHYSKGAVIAFLHEHVLGIRPLGPGYRHIGIHPRITPELAWAEGTLQSPRGPIYLRWERSDNGLHLDIGIPADTTATVHLPDGTEQDIEAGAHSILSGPPVRSDRVPYTERRPEVPAAITAAADELEWHRFDPAVTSLGELLDDPDARAVIDSIVPELADNPMIGMARPVPINIFFDLAASTLSPDVIVALRTALAELTAADTK